MIALYGQDLPRTDDAAERFTIKITGATAKGRYAMADIARAAFDAAGNRCMVVDVAFIDRARRDAAVLQFGPKILILLSSIGEGLS